MITQPQQPESRTRSKRRRVSLDSLDAAAAAATQVSKKRRQSSNAAAADWTSSTNDSTAKRSFGKVITPSPSMILSIGKLEVESVICSSLRSSPTPDDSSVKESLGLPLDSDESLSVGESYKASPHIESRREFGSLLEEEEEDEMVQTSTLVATTTRPASPQPLLDRSLKSKVHVGHDTHDSKWQTTLWQDVLLLVKLLLGAALLLQAGHMTRQSRLELSNQDCIYVTGGGFSGFWFSLGRLHSLVKRSNDKDDKEKPPRTLQPFACYSAGCLGVASFYTNHSMLQVYDMARSIQNEWNSGELHRYHVVEEFVDRLLEDQHFDDDILQSMHILTSTPIHPVGFQAHMQTPQSMQHLKSLLLQTTWIPLAVGSAYTHEGHLDGAFSVWQHPVCRHHVGLASDWKLLTNTLNVNLPASMVEQFYDLGLDYGIY